MIVTLILAAGKGIRFGNQASPKQLTDIAGKPMFLHSVGLYAGMPEIDRIVLTMNADYADATSEALAAADLLGAAELVSGGETRQASIANAADATGELSRDDLVIVHNAASPNTSPEFVRECIGAAEDCDAVQACVPDTRTVFERTDGLVARVLPRSRLAYNCDPTIYRGDVFVRLLEEQRERGSRGETTIDTALELGYRIRLVDSSYDNIKVTTPWDAAAAAAAITARSSR